MSGHTAGPWYQVPTDSRVIVDRDPSRDDARVVAKTYENRWECRSCDDDAAANAAFIVRACNSHAGLLAEHKAWARDFGAALLLYLQGDHTAIDSLAHDLIIDQDKDGPVLHSHAIAKAEGRG